MNNINQLVASDVLGILKSYFPGGAYVFRDDNGVDAIVACNISLPPKKAKWVLAIVDINVFNNQAPQHTVDDIFVLLARKYL